MMTINIDIEGLIACGIDERQAAAIIQYYKGDKAFDYITLLAGGLVLDKKELDDKGVAKEKIKLLRYLSVILLELNK